MELEYVNEHIGRKIKDLRNRVGLTQQELADRTELTKGFISQLERGQVSPSVVTLLDLIECLGTTASDFLRKRRKSMLSFRRKVFLKRWMRRETVSSGSSRQRRSTRWNRFW